MQKVKVKGHSVQKLRTDGSDCITCRVDAVGMLVTSAKYCVYVGLYVCVRVHVTTQYSQMSKPHAPSFPGACCLCRWLAPSYGVVVIRYALPVSWMTSCLLIIDGSRSTHIR